MGSRGQGISEGAWPSSHCPQPVLGPGPHGALEAPFLTAPFLLSSALPFETVAWSSAFEGWAWFSGGEARHKKIEQIPVARAVVCKLQPSAKSGPRHISINKALLAPSHAHLFTYHP